MGGAAEGDGNTSGGANASGVAEGAGQIQKETGSRSLGGGAFGHPDGTHRTSPHTLTRVRSGHRAPGPGRVTGVRGPQDHQHPARTPRDAPGALERLPLL